MRASEAANVKKRWREQHDDVLFPDEVRLYLCFYTVPHARLLLVISCHLFTQLPSPATLSWAEVPTSSVQATTWVLSPTWSTALSMIGVRG